MDVATGLNSSIELRLHGTIQRISVSPPSLTIIPKIPGDPKPFPILARITHAQVYAFLQYVSFQQRAVTYVYDLSVITPTIADVRGVGPRWREAMTFPDDLNGMSFPKAKRASSQRMRVKLAEEDINAMEESPTLGRTSSLRRTPQAVGLDHTPSPFPTTGRELGSRRRTVEVDLDFTGFPAAERITDPQKKKPKKEGLDSHAPPTIRRSRTRSDAKAKGKNLTTSVSSNAEKGLGR